MSDKYKELREAAENAESGPWLWPGSESTPADARMILVDANAISAMLTERDALEDKLHSLMEGLELPMPEQTILESPRFLKGLGSAIAHKAKHGRAPDRMMEMLAANRKVEE